MTVERKRENRRQKHIKMDVENQIDTKCTSQPDLISCHPNTEDKTFLHSPRPKSIFFFYFVFVVVIIKLTDDVLETETRNDCEKCSNARDEDKKEKEGK